MQIEAHASIGWLLAEIGRGDRRFRAAVLWASVLPDIDALSSLFGIEAYCYYHHRITHTLLFSLILSGIACLWCKKYRFRSVIFTQLSFYSHYFGDYFLTRYGLYYFWPFSNERFSSQIAVPLWHPINRVLSVTGLCLMIGLSIFFKRTPFEAISENFDKRLVSDFRNRWSKKKNNTEWGSNKGN